MSKAFYLVPCQNILILGFSIFQIFSGFDILCLNGFIELQLQRRGFWLGVKFTESRDGSNIVVHGWPRLSTGGTLECPKKHVKENLSTWWYFHFPSKCPKIRRVSILVPFRFSTRWSMIFRSKFVEMSDHFNLNRGVSDFERENQLVKNLKNTANPYAAKVMRSFYLEFHKNPIPFNFLCILQRKFPSLVSG